MNERNSLKIRILKYYLDNNFLLTHLEKML